MKLKNFLPLFDGKDPESEVFIGTGPRHEAYTAESIVVGFTDSTHMNFYTSKEEYQRALFGWTRENYRLDPAITISPNEP